MLAVSRISTPTHHHRASRSKTSNRMPTSSSSPNVSQPSTPIPGLIRLPQASRAHRGSRRPKRQHDKPSGDGLATSKSEPELSKLGEAPGASAKSSSDGKQSADHSPKRSNAKRQPHLELSLPQKPTNEQRQPTKRRGRRGGLKSDATVSVDQLFHMSSSEDERAPAVASPRKQPSSANSANAGEPGSDSGVASAPPKSRGGRRGGSKRNSATNAPKTPTVASSEGQASLPLPPLAIPTGTNGNRRRGGHQRSATTAHSDNDSFLLSRSAPLSSMAAGLPDWDSPPPLPSTPQAIPSRQAHFPRPNGAGAHVPERTLIPWIETLDDEERAAVPPSDQLASISNKNRSVPNVRFPPFLKEDDSRVSSAHSTPPLVPSSPTRRSAAPRPPRHVRTASVPSMSFGYGQLPPATPERPERKAQFPVLNTGSASKATGAKFAGSRFQNAPAPTFLPMPSFEP